MRLSAIWLGAAVAMTLIVAARLELSFDLSAFFPSRSTLSHDILVEQIQRGPASRLFVIGLDGALADDREEASERMKEALSASPLFASVANGALDVDAAGIPDIVARYYPLLRDLDYSAESLAAAMQARLRDLAFGGGRALGDIIALDPYLATLDVLAKLTPADLDGELWIAADGRAVVIAESWASSIDTDAQRSAMRAIEDAFAALPDADRLQLSVTGVGAFGIELEKAIRAEATVRSIAASIALMLVLFIVFRSPRFVLLAALPLGMGFLAGLAAVSALFDGVHGITLAFGFTMLGVAIDYPLHLFSHARGSSGSAAIARIWPTLRLGVVSTATAYLALVFAGSGGLAQLGAFTVTGILVAALVTRTWLPLLTGTGTDNR
ncbi:MAG: MMPL family transporter, partial [Pseudomonadota bacterium]